DPGRCQLVEELALRPPLRRRAAASPGAALPSRAGLPVCRIPAVRAQLTAAQQAGQAPQIRRTAEAAVWLQFGRIAESRNQVRIDVPSSMRQSCSSVN
ncbi:MAG TPA: hypothetical protein VEH31_06975, partial [Streptosporangiaceae bacterium]|nr:hypothetical protein [Streptosporangiaceae bacterium]